MNIVTDLTIILCFKIIVFMWKQIVYLYYLGYKTTITINVECSITNTKHKCCSHYSQFANKVITVFFRPLIICMPHIHIITVSLYYALVYVFTYFVVELISYNYKIKYAHGRCRIMRQITQRKFYSTIARILLSLKIITILIT